MFRSSEFHNSCCEVLIFSFNVRDIEVSFKLLNPIQLLWLFAIIDTSSKQKQYVTVGRCTLMEYIIRYFFAIFHTAFLFICCR